MTDPRVSFLNSVAGGGGEELARVIASTTVRVRVSPDAGQAFAGQVLAFQLATLATRLFDRVELVGDEGAVARPGLPFADRPFLPWLRTLLPTLRPATPAAVETGAIEVAVGPVALTGEGVYVGSTAWGARLSRGEAQAVDDLANPVGALAAGTLAAGEVFKLAFRGRLRGAVESPGYSFSLLDYGEDQGEDAPLPDRVNLNAVLFGCGSIGCGFLQAAILTPQLAGRLVTVDNGRFEPKNTFKYSLLDRAAAEARLPKAVWAQEAVARATAGRFDALAFVGTAEEYVASLPYDYRLPLAVSAVDTVEARLEIQDTLPRRVVNAGIDGTAVEVSVHGFVAGPCLACLGMGAALESWDAKPIAERTGLRPKRAYELIRTNGLMTAADLAEMRAKKALPEEALTSLDRFVDQPLLSLWNDHVAYSEARVEGGPAPAARVTTAFVSAYAGVLLLAEILKEAVPALAAYRVGNSYRQDLLGVPAGGTFKHDREARGWCLCHSAYRLGLYREKYGT
jgi:hypothetical protein